MNIKKWLNGICLSIVFLIGLFMVGVSVQAGTVNESPYVDFSPDGEAFTTNFQDRNWVHYDEGKEVITGIPSSLRELEVGEHYYKKDRIENVPIGRWEVVHKYGTCCHNAYPAVDKPYHDIEFRRKECLASYYSGWNAYCADCYEPISNILMYMSKEAAESITELDLSLEYYYTCPHCTNLEQGSPFLPHKCKAISWNKYKVKYVANANRFKGYMESSTHMYNNATEDEGNPITPATRLTKNVFERTGYEFTGWNTRADDSGEDYADNQVIFNETPENYNKATNEGVITLYAQWKKSESTLHINPNGGTYLGNSAITSITQEYITTYEANPKDIVAPNGYQVSFVTGYSVKTPDIIQTRTFQEWQLSDNFHGKLEDNIYTYFGTEGMEDIITATYSYDSITLPTPVGLEEESSSSFGGWYYDEQCTSPAGKAGDKITPSNDLTLYAKRVELLLKSVNNMNPYGGSGAVDLSWEQNDGFEKTYLLYQSTDNNTWKRIYGASDLTETKNVNMSYSWNTNGSNHSTYTIPYTGFYNLTAFGAQGGNYNTYQGGLGGKVEGKIWLTKGEKVTYTLGGQDGSNGGGNGTHFAKGGGCTVINTDKKGTILVAGGGGGATSVGNGGAGGSTTSNLSTGYNGEDGGAGGGGGFRGGKAGEYIVHSHTEACYYTTSLEYTLLKKSTNYIDSWIQDYYNNSPWIGSDGHSKNTSIWGAAAHTASDGRENAHYHLGLYGNGPQKTYIPTNGNTELYISAYMNSWGGAHSFPEGTYLEVYNQNDKVLYRKYANQIPKFNSKNELIQITGGEYGTSTGGAFIYSNYTYVHDIYWNEVIPLSSQDTGVRVSLNFDVNGYNGCWYGIELKEISFHGGKEKQLKCGMTEGQVLSAKPAYGGSNYVNTTYVISHNLNNEGKKENGSFTITSEQIGFEEALELREVNAKDLASPNNVVLPKNAKTDLENNQLKIVWNESKDKGTVYYHKAESYHSQTNSKISTSNTTRNELISGTKGYYYLVDNNAVTPVNASRGTFTSNTFVTVTVMDYAQYLHICAVDVAGNISATTHIEIGKNDSEIPWGIWTDKMQITSDNDSIYTANSTDTYYVRADGATPLQLSFAGYTNVALPTYQVNHTIFNSFVDDGQEFGLHTKNHPISSDTIVTKASDLDKYVNGTSILQDAAYSITTRSEGGKKLAIDQKFLLPVEFDSKTITIFPVVGADFKDSIQYSDIEKDKLNGIQIIGDGTAPVFNNTEVLETLDLIDRNAGDIVLEIGAEDDLSGVKEFYIEIYNTDNVSRKRYDANASNVVTVNITEDEPIFSGDFIITLYAIDNVGNASEEVYSTTEFSLTTSVSRILEPHTPIFKCGESGILNIVTYGYADYIEIKFPKAMSDINPDLNRTIHYTETPQYYQEENIQFMVPLETPYNTDFEIIVTAYKGDKKLEDHPALSTIKVEETVTDEIRTRVR